MLGLGFHKVWQRQETTASDQTKTYSTEIPSWLLTAAIVWSLFNAILNIFAIWTLVFVPAVDIALTRRYPSKHQGNTRFPLPFIFTNQFSSLVNIEQIAFIGMLIDLWCDCIWVTFSSSMYGPIYFSCYFHSSSPATTLKAWSYMRYHISSSIYLQLML